MKLLLDKPTTKLFYDADEKIVMGKMRGDIVFEDYKEMLLLGAELARKGKIDQIVLDRRYITKQDAECRLWVKNYYIRKHVKPLVPYIRKVAIIESQSIVGKIYGKTILATLSLFYPMMKMRSFAELDEGLDWMIKDKPTITRVDDIIKDEKSFFDDLVTLEEELTHEPAQTVMTTNPDTQVETVQPETSLLSKLFKYFFPA